MKRPVDRLVFFKVFAVIFAILLWEFGAWGATLAELQQKGVSNRQVIEKFRLAIQQQKEVQTARQSFFWPTLDLNYNANLLDESTPLENENNSELEGSISYNLFSGFKDQNNVRASEQLKFAKEFDLQNIIQEIKYRVAIRYLEIYRNKNRLAVARAEVKLLEKQFRDARNRHKVGLIRKNDMLKLKVQLADSLQKMESARTDLSKSVNNLGFETESTIDVDTLDFDEFSGLPTVQEFPHYLSILYENQSKIKALESIISAQSYTAKSAQSAYYPFVDVSANYSKYGDDFVFGLEENGEDEIRLQMDVNLNIFDGFKKQADISVASIEVKRTRKDLHELKLRLKTELENILKDLEVARKNLSVAEGSVSQAEENQRVTDVAFKGGVESATDVLVAVLSLSQAKFNTIDARSQVFLKYYQMLRLIENL